MRLWLGIALCVNKGHITCFSVNPRGFPKPISGSSIALIAYLEELGGPQLAHSHSMRLAGSCPSGPGYLLVSNCPSGNTACHSCRSPSPLLCAPAMRDRASRPRLLDIASAACLLRGSHLAPPVYPICRHATGAGVPARVPPTGGARSVGQAISFRGGVSVSRSIIGQKKMR